MQRRRIVVPALALALAITVILVVGRGEPEPNWKGRSLSSWLKLYQQRTTGELTVAQIDEAPAALKEIGTNALPWLLKWVQYEPPGKFSRALQAAIPWKTRQDLRLDNALNRSETRALAAVEGFEALGPQAKPAVPELMKIYLADLVASRYASDALVRLGTNSLPQLLQAIDDPQTSALSRSELTRLLGQIGQAHHSTANDVVPALIRRLQDPDARTGREAALALGHCALRPDVAVPALVASLKNSQIREAAASALLDYDTASRPAVPALLEALNDSEFGAKAAEILGLLALEPFLVVPALTQSLQSTNANLRAAAARALGNFGPLARPAIPALISILRGPEDRWTQAAAADALGELALDPELVIPALTASLQSSNRTLQIAARLALNRFQYHLRNNPTP